MQWFCAAKSSSRENNYFKPCIFPSLDYVCRPPDTVSFTRASYHILIAKLHCTFSHRTKEAKLTFSRLKIDELYRKKNFSLRPTLLQLHRDLSPAYLLTTFHDSSRRTNGELISEQEASWILVMRFLYASTSSMGISTRIGFAHFRICANFSERLTLSSGYVVDWNCWQCAYSVLQHSRGVVARGKQLENFSLWQMGGDLTQCNDGIALRLL